MATRASIAARAQIARESSDASMERIAAGLDIPVPPPISGIVGKDPEMRAVASNERLAGFLATVADKVGADPAPAPEPEPEQPDAGEQGTADVQDDEPEEDEEPTFGPDARPLSSFEGMSDQDIIDLPGIGRATLKHIREAQGKRK